MSKYQCPRCMYKFNNITAIKRHVKAKLSCKVDMDGVDIVLTDWEDDIMGSIDRVEYIKLKLENARLRNQGSNNNNNDYHSNAGVNGIIIEGDNNSVNNNKVYNLTINNYKEPNLDYIKDSVCRKLMKDINFAIPGMLRYIYNNPEHPENHSLNKTNKKDYLLCVKNNNKWVTVRADNVVKDLLDKIYDGYEIGNIDMEHLQPLIDKIEDDPKFKRKAVVDIMVECYNMKRRN